MELTNWQLYTLIDCDIWSVTNLARSNDNVRGELVRLGLLRYEELTVINPWLPTETHAWKLTNLGHQVLRKNRVRALSLLWGSNMIGAALKHFKALSMEDLPPLLVHSDKRIRTYTRERMKELLDGTD